jgi:protein gp37
MAENSRIEWTDHTFNPWWGCIKVSPACEHCYAETWSKRLGKDVWGNQADRRFLSDSNWKQPLKWNAEAKASGQRARVFCASMADVFEDRRDLDGERLRLFSLIQATPALDWLLLTKRTGRIQTLAPWADTWPNNVWVGTTVEDQRRADERLPLLAAIPAVVRFISAEPLLGPIDLEPWLGSLDWVILGGESGARSRPSDPRWFTDVVKQCQAAGVAVHFKQWGDWAPSDAFPHISARNTQIVGNSKMIRIGKKHAGRTLGGRTWDDLPLPRSA